MDLNEKEAFKAMFLYLDRFYQLTKLDDIGWLLGAMSILPDGETADPAVWNDWIDCLMKVKENPEKVNDIIIMTLK